MKKQMVWLLDTSDKLDILEAMFKLPVEQREAFLIKKFHEKKVQPLGLTDKSLPELATECIKKGIRAKSYVKGEKKCRSSNCKDG